MSITIKLAPELEQLARAKAEAKDISVEEYLSDLVARVLQQEIWEDEA